MDEIDWIKASKKFLILMCVIFGIIGILFAIIGIATYTEKGWEYTEGFLILALAVGIGPAFVLGMCYFLIFMISKLTNLGRKTINFDKTYIRELPKHCSPAIVSLIYDLKTDVYKDYTATVLYLCTKKYVVMERYGDVYKFKLGENKEFSKLGRCERYVLNIIINNNKFDAKEFREEAIKEAQDKELITNEVYSKTHIIVFVSIIALILLIITYNINFILFLVYAIIISTTLYVYFNVRTVVEKAEYKRTENGKKLAQLFNALKKYIKEYTLIKDKNIDYIQLLEEYIPYAIALDEANTIEEYIKNNEDYRDLIYNRKV